MKTADLAFPVFISAFALLKRIAAMPMDPNVPHSSGSKTPFENVFNTQYLALHAPTQSQPSVDHGSAFSYPERVDQYHGTTSESSHFTDPIQMNNFWSNQAQHHVPNSASQTRCDLSPSSQYEHETEGDSLSPQRMYQVVAPHSQQEAGLERNRRQPPSRWELRDRWTKYNDYDWQKDLRIADLEDIYMKIGSNWDPMPARTFDHVWKRINQFLDKYPGYVQRILNGEKNAIEAVKSEVHRRKVDTGRGETKRSRVTMQFFLSRRRGLNSDILGKRGHVKADPGYRWAPVNMDIFAQTEFLTRVRRHWIVSFQAAQLHLSTLGPSVVAEFADEILSDNKTRVSNACRQMLSATPERGQNGTK